MSAIFDDTDWDLADYVPDALDFDSPADAYIKREVMNFRPVWVLYDGNGERIAQTFTREAAVAMAFREGLFLHTTN